MKERFKRWFNLPDSMLKGKIALVTGASRGIGRAIAIDFAKNGAYVILNYNNDEEGAESAVEEIRKSEGQALAIKADVSNYDEVVQMFGTIKSKFGKLNVLVNNAGISRDRTLKNMPREDWEDVLSTNLTSVYNVTKNAIPLLEENSRIINISSIVGIFGNFGQANYCASKAGIIGFTKALAKEMGKSNITVNAIAPGFIETNMTKGIPLMRKKIIKWMTPLKKLGDPEDIAYAATFLASDRAKFITGEILNVNGGLAF